MVCNTLDENKIIYKNKRTIYACIFLLLYIPSSYYMVVSNIVPGIIRVIFLLITAVLLFFLSNKKSSYFSMIMLLILISFSLSISLLQKDSLYHVIILLSAMFTGFIFKSALKFEEFLEAFLDVMYFLAIFSLVVYFIGLIMPNFFSFAPSLGYRSGYEMKNLLFAVKFTDKYNPRNYGIFWEPGAFQTFLNLALILELFFKKNIRTKYVYVFIITIITTLSTTGYIALAVTMLAFMVSKKNKTKNKKSIYIIIMLIGIGILLSPDTFINLIFGKLEGLMNGTNSNISTQTRMDAIVYPLNSFFNNPLTGLGYNQYQIMAIEKCNKMPTFTILNWFALYGISWGGLCTFFYLVNIWRTKTTKLVKVLILVSLILVVSTEDYIQNAFIYVFIFYGCDYIKIGKERVYDN